VPALDGRDQKIRPAIERGTFLRFVQTFVVDRHDARPEPALVVGNCFSNVWQNADFIQPGNDRSPQVMDCPMRQRLVTLRSNGGIKYALTLAPIGKRPAAPATE